MYTLTKNEINTTAIEFFINFYLINRKGKYYFKLKKFEKDSEICLSVTNFIEHIAVSIIYAISKN